MSEKLKTKYYPESEFSKEPFQSSEDAAGYVFALECRTILAKTCSSIPLDFKMAIPNDFYGKIFPRSGLLKQHLVTAMQELLMQIIGSEAVLKSY